MCSLRAKLRVGANSIAKRHGGLQRLRGDYLIEAMAWRGCCLLLKSRRDAAACSLRPAPCALRHFGAPLRSYLILGAHHQAVPSNHLSLPSTIFATDSFPLPKLTMAIIHIVLFEWKSTATNAQVDEVRSWLLCGTCTKLTTYRHATACLH